METIVIVMIVGGIALLAYMYLSTDSTDNPNKTGSASEDATVKAAKGKVFYINSLYMRAYGVSFHNNGSYQTTKGVQDMIFMEWHEDLGWRLEQWNSQWLLVGSADGDRVTAMNYPDMDSGLYSLSYFDVIEKATGKKITDITQLNGKNVNIVNVATGKYLCSSTESDHYYTGLAHFEEMSPGGAWFDHIFDEVAL
jgi:hypothetical protein